MKILHIIDHNNQGGAQRIVQGILNACPDYSLLVLRTKGEKEHQLVVSDEQVLMKPRGRLAKQILRLFTVSSLIRREGLQIIHLHLSKSWLFGIWLHWMIPKQYRPVLVFHEHDSIILKKWYYPLLVRTAHRMGILVAVSKYIQQQMTFHRIPVEDIFLLHNYVDLNRFSPGKKPDLDRFGLKPEQVTSCHLVGFAGRLVDYKGWELILKVAYRLRDQKIRFVIAGGGKDEKKVKQLIKELSLEDSVFLFGYIDEMTDFYQLIDILVVASKSESFGLVQLEAQASGTPVIQFENQTSRELSSSQSTVIVPFGDVDAMIEKISTLLHDDAFYMDQVNKGLENAQKYGKSEYLVKLGAIYAQALSQKGRP